MKKHFRSLISLALLFFLCLTFQLSSKAEYVSYSGAHVIDSDTTWSASQTAIFRGNDYYVKEGVTLTIDTPVTIYGDLYICGMVYITGNGSLTLSTLTDTTHYVYYRFGSSDTATTYQSFTMKDFSTGSKNYLVGDSTFLSSAVPCRNGEDIWGSGVYDVKDCLTDWDIIYSCENCNQTKTEDIEPKGHIYETWDETRAADCTTDGSKSSLCVYCEDEATEVIPALGHDWLTGEFTKESCTANWAQNYSCSTCSAVKAEYIIPTGHTYTSWQTQSASCGIAGKKYRICTTCGYEDASVLNPTGKHTWTEWEETRAATCTTKGSQKRTCVVCQKTEIKSLAIISHDWSKWKTTKKATALASGSRKRTCSECGETEKEKISKLKAKVTLKVKKKTLKVGRKYTLKIKNKTYGDKVSKWTSSKKSVATVNKKGVVTARKKGTAKITLRMKSGAKATCTIKVK